MKQKIQNMLTKMVRYMPVKYADKIADIMGAPCINIMGRGMVALADMLDHADPDIVQGALHGWFLCLSNLPTVNLWAGAPDNKGWAICDEDDAHITYLSLCIDSDDYSQNPGHCIAEMREVGQDLIDHFEVVPADDYAIKASIISEALIYFDKAYNLTRRMWSNQRALVIPMYDINTECLGQHLYRVLGGEVYPHYAIFGENQRDSAARRSEIYTLAKILANSIVVKAFANSKGGYRISQPVIDKLCWMHGRIITPKEWPYTLTDAITEAMLLNCPWRDPKIELDRYEDPQFYDGEQDVLYEVLESLDY